MHFPYLPLRFVQQRSIDLVVVPTTSLASNKPGSTLGSVALAILRRMEV